MKFAVILLLVIVSSLHAAPYGDLAAKLCPQKACDCKLFRVLYFIFILCY